MTSYLLSELRRFVKIAGSLPKYEIWSQYHSFLSPFHQASAAPYLALAATQHEAAAAVLRLFITPSAAQLLLLLLLAILTVNYAN